MYLLFLFLQESGAYLFNMTVLGININRMFFIQFAKLIKKIDACIALIYIILIIYSLIDRLYLFNIFVNNFFELLQNDNY